MPPHSLTTTILLLLLLLSPHATSSPPPPPHCPPFTTSPPPYPFSPTPNLGHPSFQIHCSNPHSTLSINNLTFTLLHYSPISSSILISPQQNPKPISQNCLFLPSNPINFSNSPFKVSDSSCSRLSLLNPCTPLTLPNCTQCPNDCKLVKSPISLVSNCVYKSTNHDPSSEEECQKDILGVLVGVLSRGIEIEWDEYGDEYFSGCEGCRDSGGECGYNSTRPDKPFFVCFRVREHGPNKVVVFIIIILFVCLLAITLAVSMRFRSKQKKLTVRDKEDPTVLYLQRHRSASLLPPVFTYEELENSTNRFDLKRKIGDGGFGCVYLGQLYDGRIVAVKHLHRQCANGAFLTKSFCNEILILSSIKHPNLVKLHGYCSDTRGLILVYDYVTNGTLFEHLHGSKKTYRKGSITWPVRVNIALQIATAIEYLHFSVVPPIVHRDITSSNIFMEKDMTVKLGDFGLSRLLKITALDQSDRCVWTGPQGTPGYLDPDYHHSFRLTEKSDVYSLGVVLLELVTGMRAVDQNRDTREVALVDMAVGRIQMGLLGQVVDPVLVDGGGDVAGGVAAMAELAFRCVAADKDDRPDAREVVVELRRIKEHMPRGGGGDSRASNVVVPDDGV